MPWYAPNQIHFLSDFIVLLKLRSRTEPHISRNVVISRFFARPRLRSLMKSCRRSFQHQNPWNRTHPRLSTTDCLNRSRQAFPWSSLARIFQFRCHRRISDDCAPSGCVTPPIVRREKPSEHSWASAGPVNAVRRRQRRCPTSSFLSPCESFSRPK
jgi:hypothetical protein